MLKKILCSVTGVLLLTGCSASIGTSAEQEEVTATTTTQPKAAFRYSFRCITKPDSSGKTVTHTFPSYEDVWESHENLDGCYASELSGNYFTDEQLAVLQHSDDINRTFETYQEMCADMHLGYYAEEGKFLSEPQMEEIDRVLQMCPNQPGRDTILGKYEASREVIAQRESGIRFASGVYKVHEDVQPGFYVSEGNFKNCYWERLDSAGNIIDNNFISNAFRVELEISPSDFSFSSSGCGEFVRQ